MMNIYADGGDKVIYTAEGGYDHDKEQAAKHLVAGQEYAVNYTTVHNWSSTVVLKEVPGQKFNTVMFEDV